MQVNAFNPKTSILDKLGKIVAILEGRIKAGSYLGSELNSLVNDEKVRAWMARMRELGRLPPVKSATPFTDGLRTALQNPTNTIIEPPAPGRRVGYTLSARHPTEGFIVTYAEATTIEVAFQRCFEEFPLTEKFSDHIVTDTETGVETVVPEALLVVLTTGLGLGLEIHDVVDSSPSGLSLDDD